MRSFFVVAVDASGASTPAMSRCFQLLSVPTGIWSARETSLKLCPASSAASACALSCSLYSAMPYRPPAASLARRTRSACARAASAVSSGGAPAQRQYATLRSQRVQ